MGKKVGKIGLILISIGVLFFISVSTIMAVSQKNQDTVFDSPLFTLRTQQAIDKDLDFSVDYLQKEDIDNIKRSDLQGDGRSGHQGMEFCQGPFRTDGSHACSAK